MHVENRFITNFCSMFYRFLFISIVLLSFAFPSCKATKNRVTEKKLRKTKFLIDNIAKNKFADSYKVNYNPTREYAMVLKRVKEFSKPYPDLKYFVFSISSKTIIIEDSLSAGNVYWEDNYLLKAFEREHRAKSPIWSYGFDVKKKIYVFE